MAHLLDTDLAIYLCDGDPAITAKVAALDRMIAAQALVHRASFVTMNAGDYADIPELALLAW